MVRYLKGKRILITGGTGSIGSTIARKALSDGAKLVKVFSNDENGLFELENELGSKKVLFFHGDIRDEDRVNYVSNGTDIIFHAAALKHVDRCEFNPFEAVTINIFGTKNVITVALKQKIKKVVFISTDKAVNPIGVMGATKLLSEKLISAEALNHNSKTIFASVRFGNVLNTRGSIVPFIEKQIRNGGPITLTDRRMKRYFMTMEDAINLIILTAKLAKGGETFVMKMPMVNLKDLFETMKEFLSPKYGYKPSNIKTKIIGMRPGEKIVEYLLTNFEMQRVLETKEFFIIPSIHDLTKKKYPYAKKPKNVHQYLENIKPVSKNKILEMLQKTYGITNKIK